MGEARNKPTNRIDAYGLSLMIIIGVAARCSAIECSAVQLCSNAVHRRILLAQRILLAESRDASA